MKRNSLLHYLAGMTFLCVSATGLAITIDFEGLTDSTGVGSTYSGLGVTFSGATVLTSGISLNESEFPPHSGLNVVFDDGGPLSGVFTTPVSSLSAYLTYVVPVTLYAYDSGGSLLGSITSAFADNTVSSGGTPNELFAFNSAVGIKSFSFVGDPTGASFTLDDFSCEPTTTAVPDTGSCGALLVISLAALQLFSRGFARLR